MEDNEFHYIVVVGSFLALGTLIILYDMFASYIRQSLQTPLPKITTAVIVPEYTPIDRPYNPLSTLDAYCKKYHDKLATLKEEVNNAEIEANLAKLAEEHVEQLLTECAEINGKISGLRPFATENGVNIARSQLADFIANDDVWRNIDTKYGKSTIAQIEQLLTKFEEIYYNKACEMLDDDDDDDEPVPEMKDIYYDEDDYVEDDEEYNDTTKLTAPTTPPPPTHADKAANLMANNEKYAYIQLYLYDLWLAHITAQITAIQTGTRNNDYVDRAKEQYYRSKYQRLMHCILLEATPLGNVYMYYNADNSSFEYYSDKTVPFPVLETVARKYVITYRCKELYVDIAAETVEMCEKDTIAYRKTHAFSGPKPLIEMTARAAVSDRQAACAAKTQSLMTKAAIRSWGESSSLRPNEPVMQKYKRKVNNFVKKGNIIQCKLLQPVDRKLTNRRLKMSFADWARERDAAKTAAKVFPGMSMPDEIRKLTKGNPDDDSATF